MGIKRTNAPTPSSHEIFSLRTRLPRPKASLLSTYHPSAGVRGGTSRSIKPRERDRYDLHLFFLIRILTRPTNHPRHAASASDNKSKPVRPHFQRTNLLYGLESPNARGIENCFILGVFVFAVGIVAPTIRLSMGACLQKRRRVRDKYRVGCS